MQLNVIECLFHVMSVCKIHHFHTLLAINALSNKVKFNKSNPLAANR